jgi:FkbM family methyltransferase
MGLKKFFKSAYLQFRFWLSGTNSPVFIFFYKYFFRPEKDSIDYYLDQYSKYRKGDVTLIQVGANDGMTFDPVHKFIKRDNWKGVLLEPQKYVYDKFLSKIYRKNKGIVTLNAAIGKQDGSMPIYKIGFTNERWASGLTTFNKKVLEHQFERGHVERRAKRSGIPIPKDKSKWIVEEKVDVVSFSTLLDKYNLGVVNLLQIDTEGFDYEVIKMVNFSRMQPDIIVFENALIPGNGKEECNAYLVSMGYKVKEFDGNSLCVRSASGFDVDAA